MVDENALLSLQSISTAWPLICLAGRSTVRYVTAEERPQVLYRDLEIESPYNTYRHRGLPPGPIGSPGLASMLAVLNPAETDYFFFVSRRDGTHEFTKTYNEHLTARRLLGY